MVRAVKSGGNGSFLWPKGCVSIEDVPIDLIGAIQQAFRILDWFDNMGNKEEIPPEWMWTLDKELDMWWEEVDRRRKENLPGGDKEPEGGMMSNELADELRRG